jgi:CRP/FNR family transcriptional regulator, cyclic AMP receptor protein
MDKIRVLSSSPLFEMLSNDELEGVAALSVSRLFGSSQLIFEEGELGDGMYVIARGEVELLCRDASGDPKTLKTLSSPEFFGEMSLLEKEYRSVTIRTVSDSELLHLTAESLTEFRKDHPDGFTFIVINIARVLATRLREATIQIASRL